MMTMLNKNNLSLFFGLLVLKNLIQLSNPAATCYGDTYATTTLTCSGEQLCFKSIALPSYTVQRGCSYDNLTSMNQIIYASNICLNTGCFNTTGTDTLVRIYLCEQDLCNRATVTSYLKPVILLSTISSVLLYFLS